LLPQKKYALSADFKECPLFHQVHQIEWKNDEYIVFSVKLYRRKTNFFDKDICISIINEMGKKIQMIDEIPF
jgi:hypothetical protein